MASLVQIASSTVSHKHSSEGLPSGEVCTAGDCHTGVCPSKVSKVNVKTLDIRSSQFGCQHDLQILSGAVRIVVATKQDDIVENK